MRSVELAKKIGDIKDKGFIKTLRNGPTGIGHLLETELGLSETNIAIPDIGGRVELKATRKNANSLITLFTFNRAVWKVKQYDLIEKYGYLDTYGRKALYTTVNVKFPNNQGFYLLIDKQKNLVMLRNINENMNIAEWSSYVLAGKFMTKLDRLLLVLADNKLENDIEYFHFNEAYLLENPTPEKFLEAFEKNELMIDIRMHLKDSNGVRNHGTALRMSEKNLIDLYTQKRQLI
jgi:hypothetical protein